MRGKGSPAHGCARLSFYEDVPDYRGFGSTGWRGCPSFVVLACSSPGSGGCGGLQGAWMRGRGSPAHGCAGLSTIKMCRTIGYQDVPDYRLWTAVACVSPPRIWFDWPAGMSFFCCLGMFIPGRGWGAEGCRAHGCAGREVRHMDVPEYRRGVNTCRYHLPDITFLKIHPVLSL